SRRAHAGIHPGGQGMTLTPTTSRSGSSIGGDFALPNLASSSDPRLVAGAVAPGANNALGARTVIPSSGVLHDLAVYVNVQSGNLDVGVYDTASPRNRLYHSGSVACPAAGAWQIVGDPALSVVAGQQYDFLCGVDNGTVQLGRGVSMVANATAQLPAAYTLGQVG